jgi:hypothetical protein
MMNPSLRWFSSLTSGTYIRKKSFHKHQRMIAGHTVAYAVSRDHSDILNESHFALSCKLLAENKITRIHEYVESSVEAEVIRHPVLSGADELLSSGLVCDTHLVSRSRGTLIRLMLSSGVI